MAITSIDEGSILNAMNAIDIHVNSLIVATQGIKGTLELRAFLDDDPTTNNMINHYLLQLGNYASGIVSEINSV